MSLPIIPNIALGKTPEYCDLAKNHPTGFASATLRWILLKSSGMDTDAVMRDYLTLDALLKRGGGSQVAECSFSGYSRLAVASGDISITASNSLDNVTVDIITDPVWSPTGVEVVGAIALCFDSTGSGPDTSIIPIYIDAIGAATISGSPFTYQVATGGFYTSSQG